MFRLTAPPKEGGRHIGKQRAALQSLVPPDQNLFKKLGIDIFLRIREYMKHVDPRKSLNCFKNLMLTNKVVYEFLFNNRLLNGIIAKDTVGFNYLSKVTKKLCTFGNLINFRDNITGLHLLYSEYEKSQFLKNGKLAFKAPYVYYMHLNNLECFDESFLGYSSRYQVVRGTGHRLQLRRLRHVLEQFESAHNAIVMNIYTPSNNHHPVQVHSNKVYISENYYSTSCFILQN